MATGVLQAFALRNFRFQWGADLAASWAIEMELLILGWFVLVTTDSAFMLAAFGALHFSGTLLCPMFGVLADRLNRRTMLIALRSVYGGLAGLIMLLALLGTIEPWHLFVIAGLAGLVRPSDQVIRNTLIADIVPVDQLQNAMGFSRTTVDSARIVGALSGAGLLSAIGIGPAYGAVVGLYTASVILAFGIRLDQVTRQTLSNPFAELKLGLRYMRENEFIVACMTLALLVNITAFPIPLGLLPVLAKDVYGLDANGLARLAAAFAAGSLLGSVLTATILRNKPAGSRVVVWAFAWQACVFALAFVTATDVAMVVIFVVGLS